MRVTNGTSVTGYSSSGVAVSGATESAPAGAGYFSVATAGTNANSQDVFVSDSVNHTLTEYMLDGTTMTQVGTTFTFASDLSGGAISPQEIAIDGNGNLWTTSFDGQIVEYNGSTGSPTTMQASGGALSGARGMMIAGTTAYVTVEGFGAGSVKSFSTSTANSTVSTYATCWA